MYSDNDLNVEYMIYLIFFLLVISNDTISNLLGTLNEHSYSQQNILFLADTLLSTKFYRFNKWIVVQLRVCTLGKILSTKQKRKKKWK